MIRFYGNVSNAARNLVGVALVGGAFASGGCSADFKPRESEVEELAAKASGTPHVQIAGIRAQGALCEKGTYETSAWTDGIGMQVLLTGSIEHPMRNAGASTSSGACRMVFELRVPQGYQFNNPELLSSETFVQIGGSMATSKLTMQYTSPTGAVEPVRISHVEQYAADDEKWLSFADPTWSPCASNKPLVMTVDVQVTVSGGREAYYGLSAFSVGFEKSALRKCTAGA